MKILLVCAGGMSTSILMQKMKKYWADNGEELQIEAVGVGSYVENAPNYDIILVGPQIAYRLKEIQELGGLPAAAIGSLEYAIGDCPKIMKLAKDLYMQK